MSESPSAVRRILRPIRPNPLMPTLTAISVEPPDVTDKLVSLSRLWDKDCRDCGTESPGHVCSCLQLGSKKQSTSNLRSISEYVSHAITLETTKHVYKKENQDYAGR